MIKPWIHAARPRTLPLALSGSILGSFLAAADGVFRWNIFLLAALTSLLLQILSNLANDYGDFTKGTDNHERIGPDRMVSTGAITPRQMIAAIGLVSSLALVSGIFLILQGFPDGNAPLKLTYLALGLASIGAAINYTVGKNPYGYSGFGDLFVFIFFGIIAVTGTYFLHGQLLRPEVLLPAVSLGLLSTGVLNLNNLRDERSDILTNKHTLVVKHGWDTHIFELIHECQEFELNYLEAYYIKLYDTFNTEHGMNLTSGGDHYKMSNETKLKIGAASKLRVCSEETRKKLSENSSRSFLGKHHSEESKEKLRTAHIGKKLTEEHIQKLSDSHKGYRATEEQKQKMGEAHLGNTNCLGHKLTKEHIEKIIEGRKWYKPSEETINKIIESNKYRFKIKNYEIYDENNNLKYRFKCVNLQAELKNLNLTSTFQKSYRNKRKIKSGVFKGWYII